MDKLLPAALLLSILSGCGAQQASNRDTLPVENVTQCRTLCNSAGMSLESIVVVANQTGCVCGASSEGGAAAASGGAVAVMLAEQAQQQQQQRQRQR